MANWVGDPKLSGYNPSTFRLDPNLYTFATPGTVDLNGITRIGWGLVGYDNNTHPMAVKMTATIHLPPSDFSAAGAGTQLGMSAFILDASTFSGTPTPAQIIAAPQVQVYRSTFHYSWSGSGSPSDVTDTFIVNHSDAGNYKNTKFWALVIPTKRAPNSAPSAANDIPLVDPNTVGRALSYWTSRTPTKPVITSPNGGVYQPQDVYNLAFTAPDPDALTPDDAERYNADLAGVVVEYAPVPTAALPNPTWARLPFTGATGSQTFTYTLRQAGDWTETIGILKNRGLPILLGSSHPEIGHADLPSGEWQIRVRTIHFAHPYPAEVRPFGAAPGSTWSSALNVGDVDQSPWSDAIKITVTARVPAPVPVSPVDNNAYPEGEDIHVSWEYRNAAEFTDTQREQAQRWIQIREVGTADWTTIFAGDGTDDFVEMPMVIDNPPVVASQYFPDGGFEAGGTEGWTGAGDPLADPITAENVTGAGPHSGTHHLRVEFTPFTSSGSDDPYLTNVIDVAAGHDSFDYSGWVKPHPDAFGVGVGYTWYDESLTQEYPDPDGNNQIFVALRPDVQDPPGDPVWPGDGWIEFDFPALRRPPGAEKLYLVAVDFGYDTSLVNYGVGLDDLSLTGQASDPAMDYTLEATTNYEWRVRTVDESGSASVYSAPAQFWVVPAPDSGAVLPPPSNTTDGGTLGCGTYDVYVYRRGGKVRVGRIGNISHLEWNRVRDDISDAKVVITGWDPDCGNLLAKLQSWAYEIVIFRNDGRETHRVWEGPITLLTYEDDRVTISAKDVMAYAYRRAIRQKMSDTRFGAKVTARARQIIMNAFAPDDPNVLAHLKVLDREDDAMQYRSTPAYSRTAFEEVDDMAANAGLDYTAVGRSILLWGTKHRIGTLPEFRDADLGNSPIVSEYGMSMSNRYIVSNGDGVWGAADRLDDEGKDETYGLVEMLSSTWATDTPADTGTYTQQGIATMTESFEGFAERSISDRYGPPVVVRVPDNTSLSQNAPISIQHLVPGVVVPLRSNRTLRSVAGNQKLDSVKVTVDASAGGLTEVISVTMSPFSRDDAATEGVTE